MHSQYNLHGVKVINKHVNFKPLTLQNKIEMNVLTTKNVYSSFVDKAISLV